MNKAQFIICLSTFFCFYIFCGRSNQQTTLTGIYYREREYNNNKKFIIGSNTMDTQKQFNREQFKLKEKCQNCNLK